MIPVRDGRWTTAAAAQARVVARMRERGHSLEDLRRAVRDGRLAFGYVEDLIPGARERPIGRAEAAAQTGLEEELIERVMSLLGTPTALEGTLNEQDVEAIKSIGAVLGAGFPLVALLQLVRVYAQSIRKIAEAEVRLFHLYVHEPLIRQGVDALEMAEEMEGLARDLLPLTSPLMEYIHERYLRFYIEQDVVGHMEVGLRRHAADGPRSDGVLLRRPHRLHPLHRGGGRRGGARPVERFVETVEATLPAEALDREDDRRRGDDRLARPGDADRVGGRLPHPVQGAPAAARRASTSATPSTATATTSAPTSTSPTASSPGRSAAR